MNYDDYYAQQVGGGQPYFAGARVQRGHGFGSLFGGLLRTVVPLIKRGALALGNRILKTGEKIAGDVLSGQNIRTAAKRRTKTVGRDLQQSLLAIPSSPSKRVKRTAPKGTTRRRAAPVKRAARRRLSPSLDSGGPIEFVVPGAGEAYIDLANTYLLVRDKVVRGAGTHIADDAPVAPVNNWLHSLFS